MRNDENARKIRIPLIKNNENITLSMIGQNKIAGKKNWICWCKTFAQKFVKTVQRT